MRLIDADALLDEFISLTPYGMGVVGIKYVDDLIKSQPTAYDVDKVIEELEKIRRIVFITIANTGKEDDDTMYAYVSRTVDKAIDIVKRGGRL